MRLKDGRTRLSYKAEHVDDMETGTAARALLPGSPIATPPATAALPAVSAGAISDEDRGSIPR